MHRGHPPQTAFPYRQPQPGLPPLPNTSKSHAGASLISGHGHADARSRSSTPQAQAQSHVQSNGDAAYEPPSNGHAGASTSANGGTIKNGHHFFPCLVCGRAIASARYAPHLASCLGLTGSTRRAATARANAGNGSGTGNGNGSSGGAGYADWANVGRGRTPSHHYAHSDSGRGGEFGDDDERVGKSRGKGSSPMGKGGGLMKKATKTLPGSGANRSGSAPPASLLASKGRPYPLPPSKLRGASPSPSHLGRGAAAAPARGTGLDERDDSAVFGVGAGAGTRGPKGKPLGGFKSSAIVVEDDDDDDDMELVA